MLDEQRIAAYVNLIENLLNCPNGQENAILQQNIALIDQEFIFTVLAFAQKLNEEGNDNHSRFLLNLAENLVGWVEERNQVSETPETYLQLIQQLLQAEASGNESQVYQIIA